MDRPGTQVLKPAPAVATARPALAALLADGRWHAGTDLGAAMGVGRSMVWKQVAALRALGAPVQGRPGLGYRVVGGLDLLSPKALREGLSPAALARLDELLVVDSVDSTNRLAAERVRLPDGPGCVACMAEHQRAGRGRLGRRWVSPYAANIYLSVAWRHSLGVGFAQGLALALGVTVAECLRGFDVPVGLKWPNDIVSGARKLAGVLLEISGEWGGRCEVVAGVGINVHMNDAAAGDIDQPWTTMTRLSPRPLSRNALGAALIDAMLALLHGYAERGLASYRARWLSLDVLRGRRVSVRVGARRLIGTARGIDDAGALLLDTATGMQAIHSGEASVRSAAS